MLALFAFALLVTMRFALPARTAARPDHAAAFVWAAVLFSSFLELRGSFDAEREHGTMDALRIAPVDPAMIFFAKLSSSAIVLGVLEVILVPLAVLLFAGRPSGIAPAIGVTFAATVGLLAWGTLFAAASSQTRASDVVLPIVLFPLVVPQTIAAVRLLAHFIAGSPLADPATGLILIGAFDLAALGTGILLFEYVLDE